MCVVLWLAKLSAVGCRCLSTSPFTLSTQASLAPHDTRVQRPLSAATVQFFFLLFNLAVASSEHVCFFLLFYVETYKNSGCSQNELISEVHNSWCIFFVFRFRFTVLLSFGLSFHLHAIRFHSRLQCVVALYANNGDVSADSNSFSWIPSVAVAVFFYLSLPFARSISLTRDPMRSLWLALVWFGTKARKFSYTHSMATVLYLSLPRTHTKPTTEWTKEQFGSVSRQIVCKTMHGLL